MKKISVVLFVVLFGILAVNIGLYEEKSVEVSRIEYKEENEEEDISIGKLYLDNKEISAIPEKGSNVEFEKGDCTNGTKVSWNKEEWSLSFDEINGETSCSIYFKTKSESGSEVNPEQPTVDPKNPSEGEDVNNPSNPETGVFFSFVMAIIVIGTSIGVIYYGKRKAKFRKL